MSDASDLKALVQELSLAAASSPEHSLTRITLNAGIQAAKTPGMHPLALIVSMVVAQSRAMDALTMVMFNLKGLEELEQKEAEEWLKQQEEGNAKAGGVTDNQPVGDSSQP